LTEPAPIRSHDDLVDYIRARKEELGLSNEFIEEKCLMTKGHCDKLIGPSREKGLSRFTLDYFMTLLAFQLVPQPDPEQEARMHGKWERRSESQVHRPNRVSKVIMERARPLVMREHLKAANAARNSKLSCEQRSRIARKAAKVRWRKARRELAATAAQAHCEERVP
jgi:hypothetical protein